MQIAITGATGFVGRHLMEAHRKRGDTIRILRRPTSRVSIPSDIEIHEGDLAASNSSLKEFAAGVDVLYHCAGEIHDKTAMATTHIAGTTALVQAASGVVKHWVQVSSVAVYGHMHPGVISENTAATPDSEYGRTKLASDNIVRSAAAKGAFSYSVVQPSAIYSGSERNGPLVQLISLLDRGWFFFVGAPGAMLNFVHIDDVVQALVLCATQRAALGNDYIVSDQVTMEQLVDIVTRELGISAAPLRLPEAPIHAVARVAGMLPFSPLNVARLRTLTQRVQYSAHKITNELSYSPTKILSSELRDLAHSYKGLHQHGGGKV